VLERSAGARPRPKERLQDIDAIRGLFASPVILALFDMPWTPVFLAAIFIFHPMLGWVALAGGAILILAAILNQLLTYKRPRAAASRRRRRHGLRAGGGRGRFRHGAGHA
jgi:ABC-type protease/lipase transport system fused ATPase/permease subunit